MGMYRKAYCSICKRSYDIRLNKKEQVCKRCGQRLEFGDNLYIDYYVDGRRKREKIGPDKRQAKNVLRKRQVQIAENRFFDIKKEPKVLFEDIAKIYLDYARTNKKSYKSDELHLKQLATFFGGKYLYQINPLMIEEYKKTRSEKVSKATVNRELATMKHMFNKAIQWKRANKNPVREVKLFREDNRRLRYLEKWEIKALIEACSNHLIPIVITALNTGLRKGNILNLKWGDINFEQEIIFVKESKSGESLEIPMNGLLVKTLKSIKRNPKSPYVFCNKEGKPYGAVRTSFSRALRKAGISNFRFHDLRHTFASHLIMAGVDLVTVKELLGHKSIEMTLRYAHLSPHHKRWAVERLASQMDTIWTPEPILKMQELPIFVGKRPLAQRSEHLTHNPSVEGSNPSGPTIPTKGRDNLEAVRPRDLS